MADKVKLWFDPEGDYLEASLSDAPGYMREPKSDEGCRSVVKTARIIGFHPQVAKAGMSVHIRILVKESVAIEKDVGTANQVNDQEDGAPRFESRKSCRIN